MFLNSLTIKKKDYNSILFYLKKAKLYICVTKNFKIIKDVDLFTLNLLMQKVYIFFFNYFFLSKNLVKFSKKIKGNSIYFSEIKNSTILDFFFFKNKSFNFLFFILYKSYCNYFCVYSYSDFSFYKFIYKSNFIISKFLNYTIKIMFNLFSILIH